MAILLLGASGRTGKIILKKLNERDEKLTILVRNKNKFKDIPEKVRVIEGNPYLKADIQKALNGVNLVISALNLSRANDFPWSPLRSPKDFLSHSITNLLECSDSKDLKIVAISAFGVGDSKAEMPFWFRWLVYNSNIKFPYLDHEIQENLLKNSGKNFVIIRPVGLTNDKEKSEYQVFTYLSIPKLTINRSNLAEFTLKAAIGNEFDRKVVVISS